MLKVQVQSKNKSMQYLPVTPQLIFSGNINPVVDQLVHTSCIAVSLDVCQCNVGCNVSSWFLFIFHELGCLRSSATHFSNHQARIVAGPVSATAVVNNIHFQRFICRVAEWLPINQAFLLHDSRSLPFNCMHYEERCNRRFIAPMSSLILWGVVPWSPALCHAAIFHGHTLISTDQIQVG